MYSSIVHIGAIIHDYQEEGVIWWGVTSKPFLSKKNCPGPDGQYASRWYGGLRVKLTSSVFNNVKSPGQSFHHWHFLDPRTPRSRRVGQYECRFDASQKHEDPGPGNTTQARPRRDWVQIQFLSLHPHWLPGQRKGATGWTPNLLVLKAAQECVNHTLLGWSMPNVL